MKQIRLLTIMLAAAVGFSPVWAADAAPASKTAAKPAAKKTTTAKKTTKAEDKAE